jgi:hypothetical protein
MLCSTALHVAFFPVVISNITELEVPSTPVKTGFIVPIVEITVVYDIHVHSLHVL